MIPSPVKVHTVALGVAAVVSAVIALTRCGGDEQPTTVTVARTNTVSETATVTQTIRDKGDRSGPKRGGARAKGLRFRGNGDRRLPPIYVSRGGATLHWRNTGEVFSLFSADGILIDSVAREGHTFLPTGRYGIEVIASGTWLILIPRARRAR
jgi:hypothetical protein